MLEGHETCEKCRNGRADSVCWASDLSSIERIARDAALANYRDQKSKGTGGWSGLSSGLKGSTTDDPCLIKIVFALDLLAEPAARPAEVTALSDPTALVFGMGCDVWQQLCTGHWLWCKRLVTSIFEHVLEAHPDDGLIYLREDTRPEHDRLRVAVRYDIRTPPSARWF